MKEIAIHEIQDGMCLAADVVDDKGQMLVAAGMPLARAQIDMMERRGVLTVRIVSPEDTAAADGDAPSKQDIADALGRLKHMFEGKLDDPIMNAIYVAARGMLEHAPPGR